MSCLYSSEYVLDPYDARAVLAFVFCRVDVLAPKTDASEREAACEILRSVKDEAIRRWYAERLERQSN